MTGTSSRWRAAAVLMVCSTSVAGCFTTTSDFRNDAETFIVENVGLRDTLRAEGRLDVTDSFSTATCDEPANQDEGTTFACTATDSGGGAWEFEVVITGSSKYEVNLSRAPDGA